MLGKKNEKYTEFDIMDQKVKFVDAPEPSNVIWENLEVTSRQRTSRKCGVGMVIFVFLIFTFVMFSLLKSTSGANKLKYPDYQDCPGIQQLFEKPDKTIDVATFELFAQNDKDLTLISRGTGYYQCYCKLHSSYTKIAKSDNVEQ